MILFRRQQNGQFVPFAIQRVEAVFVLEIRAGHPRHDSWAGNVQQRDDGFPQAAIPFIANHEIAVAVQKPEDVVQGGLGRERFTVQTGGDVSGRQFFGRDGIFGQPVIADATHGSHTSREFARRISSGE